MAMGRGELYPAAIGRAVTGAYWFILCSQLLVSGGSEARSGSGGIRTKLGGRGFAWLLAVVVMMSIRWVGVLIISAMLVLPSATARNVARNVRPYHLFAVLIALFCGILGLLLSFAWGTASGATIVLALAVCYAATLIFRRRE